MTTWSYLGRPALVGKVANKPGISQHLQREIKASVELAAPNFIDVHISHPLGGLHSKWKESNILQHKLYEEKRASRALSNVNKLAAAVATFVCCVANCEYSFFALSRIDTLHRRWITHGRQRNLVLLAFEKSRTKKIDLDEFVPRLGTKHTIPSIVQ